MKSTKTRFAKIDLQELKKILPAAVLDGHKKRAADFPLPKKRTTKAKAKP
jgi:hypothetical protein